MARARLALGKLAELPRADARRLEIVERTPSGRGKVYADRVTGERYTQRDLQKLRNAGFIPEHVAALRKAGLGNQIERTRERAESKGQESDYAARRIRALAESYSTKRGKPITAAFGSREFWRAVRQLERGRSNSAKGAKAKALEILGRRAPGAVHKVGQSPPTKKK